MREFIYTDDISKSMEKIMNLSKLEYSKITNNNYLLNVGSEKNISINQLAKKIKKISNFNGKIIYKKNFPDGVYNKKLDCSKLKKILKRINNTSLDDGLLKVINEYEASIL